MGIAYAITSGSVILAMAALYVLIASSDRIQPYLTLVGLAALVLVAADAVGGAVGVFTQLGIGHGFLLGADRERELALAAACTVFGVLGGVLVVRLALQGFEAPTLRALIPPVPSPDDPIDDDDDVSDDRGDETFLDEEFPEDRHADRLPLLGLVGLGLVLASNAPTELHGILSAFGQDRAYIARYAYEGFIIAIAAVAILADRRRDSALRVAAVGVVGAAIGLGLSAGDGHLYWLRGLILGFAVVLFLPSVLDTVTSAVVRTSLNDIVIWVGVGIALLGAAGAAEGAASRPRHQDLGGTTVPAVGATPIPRPSCSPGTLRISFGCIDLHSGHVVCPTPSPSSLAPTPAVISCGGFFTSRPLPTPG
jgi:hypothetical protein